MRFASVFTAVVMTAVTALSQTGSINNTIGSSGSFTIKDGSTTFFTLAQSNGYLTLAKSVSLAYTTGSTLGVIFKGADRFIHDYHGSGTNGFNTFVGVNAGNFTMSGSNGEASNNTAIGNSAMYFLTSGYDNSATGSYALFNNTSGTANTASGSHSLFSNTTGTENSGFGFQSLYSATTATGNSAFGSFSLYLNTTGFDNSAFGAASLNYNTTGSQNAAFGRFALYSNTTGDWNCAFGPFSLEHNTTSLNNSAFGFKSLYVNTAECNSAFGSSSLRANSTGTYNSAFGYFSLVENTTGGANCAFGTFSLASNTVGLNNSAFGFKSLYSNTTSNDNSSFGNLSLYNNTGAQNTAVGHKSLYTNITGYQNTAVGDSALYGNTGNYNTAIGYNAGSQVTSGANLTLIGIDANPSSGTALDEITLGNSYVATLRCNTQTISSLSDARDKRNIRDLPLGLDFLMTVKPRLFNWDRREWYKDGKPDGSKMKEEPTAGFIAQELDTAQMNAQAEWLNLVLKTNPERLEATSGNLLPVVVKAIQELKAENNSLRTENNLLKDRLTSLEQQVARALELIRHSSTQTSLTEHPNNIKEAQ